MNRTDHSVWAAINKQIDCTLNDALPEGAPVAYLDYPFHTNIGDLLIWLGAEEWLRRRGHPVLYRTHADRQTLPELPSGTVIICHGGGNFGTLYPKHQAFRMRIGRTYPDHPVVLFPQTVHYDAVDRDAVDETVFDDPRFLLLARDLFSLEAFRSRFPRARSHLCPDMASVLIDTPLITETRPDARLGTTLYLLRRDIEAATEPDRGACGTARDWPDILGWRAPAMKLFHMASRLHPSQTALASQWFWMANTAARRAATIFSRHREIVTSRLHGHILASLLGLPNRLVDNSYGKNRRYFMQWHADLACASLAESV